METFEANEQKKMENPLKKWVVILGILSVILFITTLIFGVKSCSKSRVETQMTAVTAEKDSLSIELQALLAEHERIKAEAGELAEQMSEKDSIIMANAAEIQKLIAQQADYNKIKKQLARLQSISKEYVEEMNKLIEENKVLKEENTQLNESLTKSREENTQMAKSNENLTAKINTAAKLKAYNIRTTGVYKKSKKGDEVATDKASKVRRIKTTFTLAENSLIEPGALNVYCRVSVPGDGRVLTPGKSDAYTFMHDGQRLQYTAKSSVNYVNKAENVTMYWDLREGDKAVKGTYIIQVYSDDSLLGETRMILQ